MLISARRALLRPILAATAAMWGLTAGSSAFAQGGEPDVALPAPALWTLRDADTTIHLFGLPQFMSDGTDWRDARFDAALSAADRIVLEADNTSADAQAEMQAAVVELGVFRDGRDLADAVEPELFDRVETAAGRLGLPVSALQPLEPWLVSVQLQAVNLQRGGWTAATPPAMVIIDTARRDGVQLDYLEGGTDVLTRMAALPDAVHVAMLEQSVETLEIRPEEPAEILDAWLRGDTRQLAQIYHGPGAWADERLRQAMLIDRNAAWSEAIDGMMSTHTGTVFVAVGAGHLVGADSLVRDLRARGHAVMRR